MRIGVVRLTLQYVVDLDDASMVDQAKEALYEDLMSAVKYSEVHHLIEVVSPDDEPSLCCFNETDIEEFLIACNRCGGPTPQGSSNNCPDCED